MSGWWGGEKRFGFRLLAEAAEFQKLPAIDAEGEVKEKMKEVDRPGAITG